MAEFADPVGNGASTAWTNTWANVDDAVRDPASGDGATISSSTDEAAEDIVFGNTITYTAGATYNLKTRGAGGNKRAIDLLVSVNDGTSWDTRRQIIAANAAEAWVTTDISSLITSQADLDGLRASYICNSTAGGGGASAASIDACYVEKVLADADAEVAWGEVEVPTVSVANADAEVAWTELEVPTANADAEVAWVEVEVPTADAAAEVSWSELEVPTASAAAEVAWAEAEIPSATVNADAEVSWAELEAPTSADAEIAWAETEIPTASSQAQVSWTEVEVPTADSRADIAWAEVQIPTVDAASQIAWATLELPHADAAAQVSWSELEVPTAGGVLKIWTGTGWVRIT